MEEFTPRNYQNQLMEIALKRNTIIYLPTGTGKTYIALMTFKEMSEPLYRKYSEGGKISIMLVNTVALVEQHSKYFENHTSFSVATYTGDMNVDNWDKEKWLMEFNKYNVLIMTCQILKNISEANFIDLNKVNLLIFDECHHGVQNQPMRQIMKQFENLRDPPRVLGLTATLLNGNCKPHKVMDEVRALETTYHGKVATLNSLQDVVGYSTNPHERIMTFGTYKPSDVDLMVINELKKVVDVLNQIKFDNKPDKILQLKRICEDTSDLKKLKNLMEDCILQIQMFGTFGGCLTVVSYIIQIERIRRHCIDIEMAHILTYCIAALSLGKKYFTMELNKYSGIDRIIKNSSPKVIALLKVFETFRRESNEELCAIVFVERRFTAKIVHHVISAVAEIDPNFEVKSNFMVGLQHNPYSCTREGLFISKKNKQVIDSFVRKEINVICASNVLEEGIDIPMCTLVVKFDKSVNYRSYIQSKGRARHKSSMYFILVEKEPEVLNKYKQKLIEFREVENILNDYLIGKNEERPEPTKSELRNMYDSQLPPYYVDGPDSANVNMSSAIALLCRYCQSLPCDGYTTHAPDWYVEESVTKQFRVHILMPTCCPLVDSIQGDWMHNVTDAKRAAALKTCILLHKLGELDDNLIPKKCEIVEEDVQFLFTHYPPVNEPMAGTHANRRMHNKKIPYALKASLNLHSQEMYLHIIYLEPTFERREFINLATVQDMYSSDTCYGILSPHPFPVLCGFPTFVTLGCVNVNIMVNQGLVNLSAEDISDVKHFHFIVFNDILRVVKLFLMFDSSGDAGTLLVVPVNKLTKTIDFNILRKRYTIKQRHQELSAEEKINLVVTQDTYLRKIVSPSYRGQTTYIVTEVTFNKTPLSEFPDNTYENFAEYYKDKHSIHILNKDQPLLYVKALSDRLNLIQPRGHGKQKRKHEESDEYLVPELLVKQDFPADLWIQASFLPTVLTRVIFLLQVEELRKSIVEETGIGKLQVDTWKPLVVDEYVINNGSKVRPNAEPKENLDLQIINEQGYQNLITTIYNKDFAERKIESEFPWKNIDEPKDLERELNVTLMDIEYYENFISKQITAEERTLKNKIFETKRFPAITYEKNFKEHEIRFLKIPFRKRGPELRDLYKALTTIKSNDIVNLERLETLGDSFLKLISTLYISMRFPKFNEGESTTLKGRMVSNKNLYYLAVKKDLGGIMRVSDLSPREDWVPPCFSPPKAVIEQILNKSKSLNGLFRIKLSRQEQETGILSGSNLNEFECSEYEASNVDDVSASSAEFLNQQYIGDKNVSDVVESIIGLFLECEGFTGAVKIVEWFGIIPKSENLMKLIAEPPPCPFLKPSEKDMTKFKFMLPDWRRIQQRINYEFKDCGYMLQAFTHASYTLNRLTCSYEKLEFLGDAVLDFLITCHIYDTCGNLNPGELTDLRSALVNNNTFASLAVRLGLHKSLLMINAQLQKQIDKFAKYLESKNYEIDDEVIILLDEDDMQIAECVDVPKMLGDVFEALAGAIYLDSNKNLDTVWRVFYKIMHKEIETFSKNVPKNVIRKLYESEGLYPKFSETTSISGNKCLIGLSYMHSGRSQVVYGYGSNKAMAKKAAAKIALRSLNLSK